MALTIKPRESCRWDAAALGEIMLRLDPGAVRMPMEPKIEVGGNAAPSNLVIGSIQPVDRMM